MARSIRSLLVGGLLVVGALLSAPSTAHADSGRWNLRVNLGPLVPPFGLMGDVAIDYQLAPPVALEASVGAAAVDDGQSWMGFATISAGARFRFFDDREGYLNQPGGNAAGNFFVAPHLGVALNGVTGFGFLDAQIGYEFSLLRPLSLGFFARPALVVGPNGPGFFVQGGISLAFELAPLPRTDRDGDGLYDDQEVNRWHTDPRMPDTDGDGLNDGLEVRTTTVPTVPDTDGDGVADGREDANRNGVVDADETDPRARDTDQGGSADGWERAHNRNPRDGSDDDLDRDQITDERDACLGTPSGVEVDARGCAILRPQLVLDGITFAYNSADIEPASEQTLVRAAQLLRDNPGVRVEIGGHTDNRGGASFNLRLSEARAQSVANWLISHEIGAERLAVRGYGQTRPRAPNTTEEHRAQNRRIEFRRLDQ